MSKCLNCGRDLVCDVPFIEGAHHGLKSAPHGCPEEFDHMQILSMSIPAAEFEKLVGALNESANYECGYCGRDWAPTVERYEESAYIGEMCACGEWDGKRLRGCGDGFD